MNKELEQQLEKVESLHRAMYEEISATKSLGYEALKDAAHEELRQGKKGSFTWKKDQTFNNKHYKAGDTIAADEIGLTSRARQVVNMPMLIQPTWHIEQGKRNAALQARIRELENSYQLMKSKMKAEQDQLIAIEAAEQALKNAKTRYSEIVTALDHISSELLEDPNLTDPIK
jgi:hypothetical protein